MPPAVVRIDILGDSSSAVRAVRETTNAYDDMSRGVAKAGKALTVGVTLPIAAAAAAGIKELTNSGKVAAQTEAVIRSTGSAANVTAKHVDDLATSLMHQSGADDEAIKSGENLLLTFTQIHNQAGKGNDVFDQATQSALDLSVAWGIDMSSAATKVGKALNDPVAGISALTKVGVTFSAQQKETIKQLVDTGDVLGAQKVILAELNKEVGGSAAAYGDTLAGSVERAKNELLNASAALVSVAAPAFRLVATAAGEVASFLADLPGPARTAVGVFAGLAASLGPILIVAGNIRKIFTGVVTAIGAVSNGIIMLLPYVGEAIAALQAMGLAGALAMGAITLGIGAIIAGLVIIATSGGKQQAWLRDVTATGHEWAQAFQRDAVATGNELQGVTDEIKRIDEARKRMMETPAGKIVASGSAELISESAAARALQHDLEALGVAHDDLVKRKKELQAAQQEQAAAAAGEARGLQAVADGTKKLGDVTGTTRQAILDMSSAQLAAQGGQIGYQQAVLSAQQAQQTYNDVMADGTSTAADQQRAYLDLQQANLQVVAAAQTATTTEAALADIRDKRGIPGVLAYRALLVAQKEATGDATGAIQNQIGVVDAYLVSIGKIPPDKNTVVTANTDPAQKAVDDFLAYLDRVLNQRKNFDLGQAIFIPQTAAVVPTVARGLGVTPALRATGGFAPVAQGTTQIVVNVTPTGLGADAPEIQRQVVAALRGYVNRNGLINGIAP